MSLSSIRKFSAKLSAQTDLSEVDGGFLSAINEYLSKASSRTYAQAAIGYDPEEKAFILKLFSDRRATYKATSHDVTVCDSEINKIWVALSQELAGEYGISYLQILLPDVKNKNDPNSLMPLANYKDPTQFYLGDDNQTLFLVGGLWGRLFSPMMSFSTYREVKQGQAYPLSLLELHRIKPKSGGKFAFERERQIFDGIWDYVRFKSIAGWSKRGTCPREIVADLVCLLEKYYSDGVDLKEFRKEVYALSKAVLGFPACDVNALYGQAIKVDGQVIYLADILIDCLEKDKETLLPKIQAVSAWLQAYDASFVVGEPTKLSASEAKEHLNKLKESAGSSLAEKLEKVIAELEAAGEFTVDVFEKIKLIYAERWHSIRGGALDYTSLQKHPNSDWIKFAQKLSGAGFIPSGYYSFLMPTLKSSINLITMDSICRFPLGHCIVSEDGEQLIYLPQCLQHRKSKGTFYVPGTSSRPLTELERANISEYHSKYREYLQDYDEKVSPLLLQTIIAVRQFLNEAFKPDGLIRFSEYPEGELREIEEKFSAFLKNFYSGLESGEKKRLDCHPIIFKGEKKTFAKVLEEIMSGKCFAYSCQWFAQLVIDYMPWTQFTKEIEDEAHIDEMRLASQRRIVQSDTFLINQLQFVYISLLSRRFDGVTEKVSDGDYLQNQVPKDIGVKLFELLQPLCTGGHLSDAPTKYANMMTLVKESLKNSSWSQRTARDPKTVAWLQSICDGPAALSTKEYLRSIGEVIVRRIMQLQQASGSGGWTPKFFFSAKDLEERVQAVFEPWPPEEVSSVTELFAFIKKRLPSLSDIVDAYGQKLSGPQLELGGGAGMVVATGAGAA